MKKRMLALLLSALLLTSATACFRTPANDKECTLENTDTIERETEGETEGENDKVASNDTITRSTFLDQKIGYQFVFEAKTDLHLSLFYKTENGGTSWTQQEFESSFSVDSSEEILCAKMLSEAVGFISATANNQSENRLSKRTCFTTDGGKTWEPLTVDFYTTSYALSVLSDLVSVEAYDLLYSGEKYLLCLRGQKDHVYRYIQYSSVDLETWDIVTPADWKEPELTREQTVASILENNEYDEWFQTALREDLMPIDAIYLQYRTMWEEELTFTIEMAERLFESEEEYEAWKADLEQWMQTTQSICGIESRHTLSTLDRWNILGKYCDVLRQKVIDTKYFCFKYEEARGLALFEELEMFASLRWKYEPRTYHVETLFQERPAKG